MKIPKPKPKAIITSAYKLDKLSLCFSENNPDHSLITANMLIGDHINKDIPGYSVTNNARYKASARIPLPLSGVGKKEIVVFEAGPRNKGVASYRSEFNPSKLSPEAVNDLYGLIGSWVDENPLVFFMTSRVTRCDVALDLLNLRLEDVIVKGTGLRKNGVYCDQHGNIQTSYIGTAKSRRIVAYDKDLNGDGVISLRLECRIKPQCEGHMVASMENPFEKVRLIPANFAIGADIDVPWQFIADSTRLGGLKRALHHLNTKQQKSLKNAYAAAECILPDPVPLWAAWPQTLIACGLGKELGAIPVNLMTTKVA